MLGRREAGGKGSPGCRRCKGDSRNSTRVQLSTHPKAVGVEFPLPSLGYKTVVTMEGQPLTLTITPSSSLSLCRTALACPSPVQSRLLD